MSHPRRPRLLPAAVLLASLTPLSGCRPEPPPPETPSATAGERVASLPAAGPPPSYLGSAGCADCHAEEAAAHASSPHALDLVAAGEPLPHADLGRPVEDESVLITHRIGTRRRQAWLGAHAGSVQVLPSAWSKTREIWIDHRADDGAPAAAEGDWKLKGSEWKATCAGCHPNAANASGPEVDLSPEAARGLAPGIGCEHCHGAGAEHARLAAERPDEPAAIREAIVRGGSGQADGCAHCHATGESLPLRPGEALRAGDALSDHRRIATAVNLLRPDVRFFADGRPGRAHGFATISLAQSRCFREGEAGCLSCHDPHGGGLRDSDPDASCRNCHAAQAQDDHSGHARRSEPVPLASEEPRGPDATRAPGCVDCHAPAILAFGSVDRARDHAIGIPEPELTRDFEMPDACGTCHGDRDPDELIAWLDERFPDRETPRHARAAAFRRSIGLAAIGQAELAADAVEPLLALLTDESQDPGLRASAAGALAKLEQHAASAGTALLEAASADSLELAQSAAAALGSVGTEDIPGLVAIARTHPDWRVRLVAAASLDELGDADGAAELEVLAADGRLPQAGRAQAHLQLGLALLRRGLLERALFQLEESVRLNGQSVPAWLNLGVARAGLGDEDGARLAWLTVNDLEPGSLAARRNIALLDQRRRQSSP